MAERIGTKELFMNSNLFDLTTPEGLFHQVRIDLSKEKPAGQVYSWLKENKPKLFARVINFEEAWATAVDGCDMKAVKDALVGMKGAWLQGYREYRGRQNK